MLLSAGKVIHIIQDIQHSFDFSPKKNIKNANFGAMKAKVKLYTANFKELPVDNMRKKEFTNYIKDSFLHKIIYNSFGLEENEYTIEYNEHGKPYISTNHPGDFHFSISHSNNIWVCATATFNIGIDIEAVRGGRKNVAEYYFTTDEQNLLNSAVNFNSQFFEIWTGKEAYGKLTGTGISSALLKASNVKESSILIDDKIVAFTKKISIEDGYICTIANENFQDFIVKRFKIIEI